MDKNFTPAGTIQPPEGKPIELWHGGGIVKGYKRDGAWHTEDGTSISVEGWRLIEKPETEPPKTKPPVASKPKPTAKPVKPASKKKSPKRKH